MAKKPASKPSAKQKPETTASSTAANINTSTAARPRPRVQEKSALSLTSILLFLSISLLSLIWNSEAPPKPFAIFKPNPTASKSPIFVRPRILLVTAHPDDEVLFAPTVLSLLSDSKKDLTEFWALCLSIGDYTAKIEDDDAQKQLAEARRKEWTDSWVTLGLSDGRKWILDVPQLKDNISVVWDAEQIARQVEPYVLDNGINTILTFDDGGVTGHPNHVSIPKGIAHMLSSTKIQQLLRDEQFPRLFTIKTQSANAHYGPLSSVVTHLTLAIKSILTQMQGQKPQPKQNFDFPTNRTMIYISDVMGYIKAFKAAMKHKSQWSLNTLGLVLWTNYLWVNEWSFVQIPSIQA